MSKSKWKQRQLSEEAQAPKVIEAPAVKEHLVEFAAWFASRASKIPPQHHREVLWADFKARGLSKMASMKDYDEALKKYGVLL